jgi:hypothetical protein
MINNKIITTIFVIIFAIILLIICINYNNIFLTYAKIFRPEFYNPIFLPELYPLLLNKDIIKQELYYALKTPINKIYRKNNEWSKSNNGKKFINKINNLEGWVYGWDNNDNIHENWLNFGLIYDNISLNANSKICPKTCAILKNINGINIAGFSLIKGNSKIEEHIDSTGIDNNSLGIHFGLIIPESEKNKCFLIVNNKKIYEDNFKLFGLDSNYIHSAENNSNEDRVILYIDKTII